MLVAFAVGAGSFVDLAAVSYGSVDCRRGGDEGSGNGCRLGSVKVGMRPGLKS